MLIKSDLDLMRNRSFKFLQNWLSNHMMVTNSYSQTLFNDPLIFFIALERKQMVFHVRQ